MAAPAPRPIFSYSLLSDVVADSLRQNAEVFEDLPRSAVEAVLAGESLAGAKQILRESIGHGWFRSWCQIESDWSFRAIENYMTAARIWGKTQKRILCAFDRWALFCLSNRRLPDAARRMAIEEAEAGQRITYRRAQEIAGIYCRRLAPRPQPEKKPDEPRPKSLFEQLLERFDHLSFHTTPDENGHSLVSGWAIDRETGGRKVTVREGGDLVLMDLAGCEPKKTCPKCKEEKGVGEFNVNVSRRDGRSTLCRICERKRQAKLAKRKDASAQIDS